MDLMEPWDPPGRPGQREPTGLPDRPGQPDRLAQPEQLGLLAQLLRQYMHNTEIAVTMRLSTILKTIKQPL